MRHKPICSILLFTWIHSVKKTSPKQACHLPNAQCNIWSVFLVRSLSDIKNKNTSPSFMLLMNTDTFKHYIILSRERGRGLQGMRVYSGPLADGVGCGWAEWPCGSSNTISRYGQPPLQPLLAWSLADPHHTHTYLSSCHIIHTRGCHLFCACLTLLTLRLKSRTHRNRTAARNIVSDWLWGHNSDPIYCLGYSSLFISVMWFHCHANRGVK